MGDPENLLATVNSRFACQSGLDFDTKKRLSGHAFEVAIYRRLYNGTPCMARTGIG